MTLVLQDEKEKKKNAIPPEAWDSYWVECDADRAKYYWHHQDNTTAWELPYGVYAMWKAKRSVTTGATYYINQVTEEKSWQVGFMDCKEAAMKKNSTDCLRRTFDRWDPDGEGVMDPVLLCNALTELKISVAGHQIICKAADANGDGIIDFEDFTYFMTYAAPLPLYYSVFTSVRVTYVKETGEVIACRPVQSPDKISTMFASLKSTWKYAEQCKFILKGKELLPHNKTVADFEILDGDIITAVVIPTDYMKEYFLVLKKLFSEEFLKLMEDPEQVIKYAFDQGHVDNYESRMRFREKEMEAEFVPIVTKMFIQYDVQRDGGIGEEEAQPFFSDFFESNQIFTEWATDLICSKVWEAYDAGCLDSDEQLDREAQRLKATYEKNLVRKISSLPGEMQILVNQARDQYKMLQLTRCKAAFRVLDTSHDEELQKEEMMEAMQRTHGKYKEFAEALGLTTFSDSWRSLVGVGVGRLA